MAYRMARLPMILSEDEVTFAALNLCNNHT